MGEDGFGDLVSDAHDRVERGHGLLKDHGEAGASQLAHGIVRKLGEIARRSVFREQDFAANAGLRRQQAHDSQRGDRFPGAGFANQAKNFARSDGEAQIANRRHRRICGDSRPWLSVRQQGGSVFLSRKINVQVTDIEQRKHGVYGSSGDKQSPFGRWTAEGGCPHMFIFVPTSSFVYPSSFLTHALLSQD